MPVGMYSVKCSHAALSEHIDCHIIGAGIAGSVAGLAAGPPRGKRPPRLSLTPYPLTYQAVLRMDITNNSCHLVFTLGYYVF